MSVAGDFNSKLLNRIAHERFAETRTKAFLPRRAPFVLWRQAIPAFVATSLIVLFAIVPFVRKEVPQFGTARVRQIGLDDSYLTVERGTATVGRDWSLGKQIARAERMERLSTTFAQREGWEHFDRTSGLATASSHDAMPIPYLPGYHKMRPVVRVYMSVPSPAAKEGERAY
ncbi:MAG TPA: hypothetical protein VN285_10090 [Candidatus Deferrimicrobium sp.]|nr:hypothetical protein [Candidatus Deferrimicrobium sp.]